MTAKLVYMAASSNTGDIKPYIIEPVRDSQEVEEKLLAKGKFETIFCGLLTTFFCQHVCFIALKKRIGTI